MVSQAAPAATLPVSVGNADLRFDKLNARQLRGVEFVQQHGRITNADYRALNTINDRTAARELGALRDQGILVQRGGGRGLYYEFAKPRG